MTHRSIGGQPGGLPYLSFGAGPPLVVFPGLGMTNANLTGLQRWGSCGCSPPAARPHGAQGGRQGRSGTQGIPNAQLVLYENRAHGGTFADRRFGKDVLAFLLADQDRS